MTVTHCLVPPNHRIHTLQRLVSTHKERNEWWVVSLPLRWNLSLWFHFWCHLKKKIKRNFILTLQLTFLLYMCFSSYDRTSVPLCLGRTRPHLIIDRVKCYAALHLYVYKMHGRFYIQQDTSHLMDKYSIMSSIHACKQIFVNKREYLNQFLLAKTIKWNKASVKL